LTANISGLNRDIDKQ